jgi:H+/Cl- antiporter ClcA
MEETENEEPLKKTFKEQIQGTFQFRHIIGLLIGEIAGFFYYYFEACQSYTNGLKSNPYFYIVFGTVLGYLIADLTKVIKK